MKAIETYYNGVFHRSRLEARWHFFFDLIKLPCEYEHLGFDIVPGLRYLPDFFLPTCKAHLEIKPQHIEKDECDRLNTIFHHWDTAQVGPLLFLRGDPGRYVLLFNKRDSAPLRFAKCRRCSGVCFVGDSEWGDMGNHSCGTHEREPVYFYEEELEQAARKKFDHFHCEERVT